MESSARNLIEKTFPNLNPLDYEITSPEDLRYNCIAWAAGDSGRWWEPDSMGNYYWPDGVERKYSLSAIMAAFVSLGYEVCDSPILEPGFLKIAFFLRTVFPNNFHLARQLSNGRWASKIVGPNVDIEHPLEGLIGDHFGSVVQVMRKSV